MAYENLTGYKSAWQKLAEQQSALGSDARTDLDTRLNAVGNQFKSLYKNLVGEDASDQILDRFFNESAGGIISGSPLGRSETDPVNVRNSISQFIGDTFQGEAESAAERRLAGEQGEATRLSDLYREQGRKSIGSIRDQLSDYAASVVEKVRPNLIMSLQSQGLLNTGALNESFAGVTKDVTDESTRALLDLENQNEARANEIAFSGAAAPYQFRTGNTLQRPEMFRSSTSDALNRWYDTYINNLNYQHQLGLQTNAAKLQRDSEPGLLGRLGQNFVSSFGSSAGQSWGGSMGPSQLKSLLLS